MRYTLLTAFILAAGASSVASAAGTFTPATLGSFYGCLAGGDGKTSQGLYKVNADGSRKHLWDYELAPSGPRLVAGWINSRGRLSTISNMKKNGEGALMYHHYHEFDLKKGDVLADVELTSDRLHPTDFISVAYVPQEDRIYGYVAHDGSGSDNGLPLYSFVSAPAEDICASVEVLPLDAEASRCHSFCYNPDEDAFFGVNIAGDFVKVDRTGSQSVIFNLGIKELAPDGAGLIYSPQDGYYFYSPRMLDGRPGLFAIRPEYGDVVSLAGVGDCPQYTFLVTDETMVDGMNAPRMATLGDVDFTLGSDRASVSWSMPALRCDGTELSGVTLTYIAMVDGRIVSEGITEPGATLVLDYEGLERGTRVLQLRLADGNVRGMVASVTVYAGNDTPEAPEEVRLTRTTVRWNPVDEGAHGGYVDPAKVVYKVSLNGEPYAETSDSSVKVSLDPDIYYTGYTAEVIALYDGAESEPGVSERVLMGKAFPLPYTFEPDDEQKELLTVIGEGESGHGEWHILPPVEITDVSAVYQVELEAFCTGTAGEYFEVRAGTAPDVSAFSIPVVDRTKVLDADRWKSYSNIFHVDAPGAYYLAVRYADGTGLSIRNITISRTDADGAMPDAVTGLMVASASHADLTASLRFCLPDKHLDGSAIDPSIPVRAVGKSSGCDMTAELTGSPGDDVMLTVPSAQGEFEFTVTPMIGALAGKPTTVAAFTGQSPAGYVEAFTGVESDDNMSVHLTWKAPAEALDGNGYYTPEGCRFIIGETGPGGEWSGDTVVVGPDVFEYDYVTEKDAAQRQVNLCIVAETAAGISPARTYARFVLGTSWKAPVEETFAGLMPAVTPLMRSALSAEYASGEWLFGDPLDFDPYRFAGSPDESALIGITDAAPARLRMDLPKFSTAGMADPVFEFDVWLGVDSPDNTFIYMRGRFDETEHVYTFPRGLNGWQTVTVPVVAKYRDRGWMCPSIDVVLGNPDQCFMLSGYRFRERSDSGIDAVEALEVVSDEWYGLDGCRVDRPDGDRVYIRRTVLSDGSVQVFKTTVR